MYPVTHPHIPVQERTLLGDLLPVLRNTIQLKKQEFLSPLFFCKVPGKAGLYMYYLLYTYFICGGVIVPRHKSVLSMGGQVHVESCPGYWNIF